jgi:Protein of unknown function (DUF968).
MITTAKIIKCIGNQFLIEPEEPIKRELIRKHIGSIEIRLNDNRFISGDQRRKIFAIIRDIAMWSGHEPEYIRQLMTWDFICKEGTEWFSLSNVDMTTARSFITELIGFCFNWEVPTKDTLLNQTDDIGKYLYLCLEYRKCAICNAHAQVHHVDRIGMGRNREDIVHVGLKAIALCEKHHTEAHYGEKALFEKYYIYGIKLDRYLCERLSLNTMKKR